MHPVPGVKGFFGQEVAMLSCEDGIGPCCCSRLCSWLAQVDKDDSSQVVLPARDLDGQERSQAQNHSHTNYTLTQVSNDLLLIAVILVQVHSGNQT